MIWSLFLNLTFLVTIVKGFTIGGEEYAINTIVNNGVRKSIVYLASSSPEGGWVARSVYNNSYLQTGWDTFNIETNPDAADEDQATLAGYLEGAETEHAIYDQWYNTVRGACDSDTDTCDKIKHYLATNMAWIISMLEKYAATDIYWAQVKLFYLQVHGMSLGYNSSCTHADRKLPFTDILWLNFAWDFDDLSSALKNQSNKSLLGNSHCSALIKVLPGQSEVLVAHSNWGGYEAMRRIMKRYTLPLKGVSGSSMSFSSYPGSIVSGDDFYIINSGLVAQETTNGINNNSLWAFVLPEGQLLEVVRVTVANRLAQGGRSWAKIFSQYNSGTYNNQWMIVDMNKFSPGSIKPELLWVLEQIPGHIHGEDQTDLLLSQGYWASYNVPFYPDIFNMSGNQQLLLKFGDFFSHDKCPRAQIFRRDQDKVRDVESLMALMRYNNYKHDPFAKCDCNPPYSAENAIAARCDLNPIHGSYPFPALGHRSHGATDAKVTSYRMSQDLSLLAVSGPSTGTGLPPFQWSLSDYDKQLSHRGHPDLFNFLPVTITWPIEFESYPHPLVQIVP